MATTFHLRVWTRFDTTAEAVWAIKTDPVRLERELWPYASFRLDRAALSAALASGAPASIPARLSLPGMPLGIPWPVELEEVRPGEYFRDTSNNALFPSWRHEHRIEPTPDGVRYIDAVTFTPRGAAKAAAVFTERLFQHRHRVAAQLLAADPQGIAVSVLRVYNPEEEPLWGTGSA